MGTPNPDSILESKSIYYFYIYIVFCWYGAYVVVYLWKGKGEKPRLQVQVYDSFKVINALRFWGCLDPLITWLEFSQTNFLVSPYLDDD
jgi:hypothetical protein